MSRSSHVCDSPKACHVSGDGQNRKYLFKSIIAFRVLTLGCRGDHCVEVSDQRKLTSLLSVSFVIITITGQRYSQIIRQKSLIVTDIGPAERSPVSAGAGKTLRRIQQQQQRTKIIIIINKQQTRTRTCSLGCLETNTDLVWLCKLEGSLRNPGDTNGYK